MTVLRKPVLTDDDARDAANTVKLHIVANMAAVMVASPEFSSIRDAIDTAFKVYEEVFNRIYDANEVTQ